MPAPGQGLRRGVLSTGLPWDSIGAVPGQAVLPLHPAWQAMLPRRGSMACPAGIGVNGGGDGGDASPPKFGVEGMQYTASPPIFLLEYMIFA